jgi:hypothetical protein
MEDSSCSPTTYNWLQIDKNIFYSIFVFMLSCYLINMIQLTTVFVSLNFGSCYSCLIFHLHYCFFFSLRIYFQIFITIMTEFNLGNIRRSDSSFDWTWSHTQIEIKVKKEYDIVINNENVYVNNFSRKETAQSKRKTHMTHLYVVKCNYSEK